MFPPVYQTLAAAAGVTAVVGDRIGAHGEVGQNEQRPYITWQVIANVPENGVSDLPDIDQVTVQINLWARTDTQIRTLYRAARDAIEPHAHITGVPIDQREPDTRLYWIAIQADWWLPRG